MLNAAASLDRIIEPGRWSSGEYEDKSANDTFNASPPGKRHQLALKDICNLGPATLECKSKNFQLPYRPTWYIAQVLFDPVIGKGNSISGIATKPPRLGVFAAYDIAQGDVIISETAKIAFVQLNGERTYESSTVPHNTSVAQMRCFFRFVSSTGTFAATGKAAGQLNHDCNANAVLTYSNSAHKLVLRANQYIHAHSELTVDYLAPIDWPTVHVRQLILRHNWGFTCSCNSCMSEIERSQAHSINGGQFQKQERLQDMLNQILRQISSTSQPYFNFNGLTFSSTTDAVDHYVSQIEQWLCPLPSAASAEDLPLKVDARLVNAIMLKYRVYESRIPDVYRAHACRRAVQAGQVIYGDVTNENEICKMQAYGRQETIIHALD